MKIQVQYSYTKNLGNYESERLQVGIEEEILSNQKEYWEEQFENCRRFVREALNLDYKPNEETGKEVEEMLARRGRRRG